MHDATWTTVTGSTVVATVIYGEPMPRAAMDYVRRSNRWPRPMPMHPVLHWVEPPARVEPLGRITC